MVRSSAAAEANYTQSSSWQLPRALFALMFMSCPPKPATGYRSRGAVARAGHSTANVPLTAGDLISGLRTSLREVGPAKMPSPLRHRPGSASTCRSCRFEAGALQVQLQRCELRHDNYVSSRGYMLIPRVQFCLIRFRFLPLVSVPFRSDNGDISFCVRIGITSLPRPMPMPIHALGPCFSSLLAFAQAIHIHRPLDAPIVNSSF
ncbi:hypothetical protein B0T10DRAFT_65015 [Thelonectria olida]|uniref:Uncharacterized protein n=1 Tax=Thelonectria olida TaxID=1576542 RepID=A0A9P8W1X0_9HYPO|nr:hypothetical protein B0T10DRAFT_65015 [Thelonectria olida]